MGRPTAFTAELAVTICDRIASGESLRTICAAEEMPDKATVFRWLAKDAEFRDQYARAREAQADAIAEDILDIADDGTNDFKVVEGDDEEAPPIQVVDHEHISRSKLRVDARKWLIGKLAPKKYGDRVRIGADETAPPLIPPGQTAEQVKNEVLEIFGAALAAVPKPTTRPSANDRVVRKGAKRRGAKKSGASQAS